MQPLRRGATGSAVRAKPTAIGPVASMETLAVATSIGMNWSTPLVTEYESQYGPPQFEHDPNEMTYLGSGI